VVLWSEMGRRAEALRGAEHLRARRRPDERTARRDGAMAGQLTVTGVRGAGALLMVLCGENAEVVRTVALAPSASASHAAPTKVFYA